MTKKIVLSMVIIMAAAVAHGGQKDSFWDKLQFKLEKVAPSKKGASTTAVGGVRGAKNDEATDIYWKGKDKSVEMGEEELQKFNAAIESKIKGDNELALKQFEEFLDAFPQSPFRVEGLQAVDKIKLEIAAAKNPPKVEAVVAPAPAEVTAAPKEVAPAAEAPSAPKDVAAPVSPPVQPAPQEPAAEPVK